MAILVGRVVVVGVACVALLASACTGKPRTYLARVGQVPAAGFSTLPIRAAVLVPETVRTAVQRHELQCGFSSLPVTLQTGPGLERGALQAISQTVEKADVYRDRAAAGTSYDVYVDLGSPEVTLDVNCGLFSMDRPTFESKATLRARVLDRQDHVLLDEAFNSPVQTDERVSDAAGRALAEALHALAVAFVTSTPVRAAAKLPPVTGATAAAPTRAAEPERVVERERPAERERPVERERTTLRGTRIDAPTGKPETTGIGFAVGLDYVVTAYHVIAGLPTITVYQSEKPLPATLVLRDRLTDTALLKISAPGEHATAGGLRLGDPTKMREGDPVWTLDLSGENGGRAVVHEGRIASVTGAGGDGRLFQVAMSGAQRHSGAPLLNQAGEVIGLALAPKDTPRVFQASDNGGDEGMVAVKIHYAKALLNLLPESEYVAPPPARSISTPESAKPALVYIEARR